MTTVADIVFVDVYDGTAVAAEDALRDALKQQLVERLNAPDSATRGIYLRCCDLCKCNLLEDTDKLTIGDLPAADASPQRHLVLVVITIPVRLSAASMNRVDKVISVLGSRIPFDAYCIFGLDDGASRDSDKLHVGGPLTKAARKVLCCPFVSGDLKEIRVWVIQFAKFVAGWVGDPYAADAVIADGCHEDLEDSMITSTIRTALDKQGYTLIGTHSGLKICRWNKSLLRGRGACYKHTFYGIDSHRCMECSPSNKCVFCWRHHSNPVTKEWTWAADPAPELVDQLLVGQRKLVKEMRGIPGVDAKRFEEAMKPRHAALSLVGEPLLYPQINEFISTLHSKGITTFMVTNAQFPDQLESMLPVTQLYLSVDAPTPISLRKIDRPVFKDFWERAERCLDIVRQRKERRVLRLTLVKGWNDADPDEYAKMVMRAMPDFVEIKGMTFPGVASSFPQMTMYNVPYHHEVLDFASQIRSHLGGEYDIACEHEHSCCVLLALVSRYKTPSGWSTWIDCDAFFEQYKQGPEHVNADGYHSDIPDWCCFGHPTRGFDPNLEDQHKREQVRDREA